MFFCLDIFQLTLFSFTVSSSLLSFTENVSYKQEFASFQTGKESRNQTGVSLSIGLISIYSCSLFKADAFHSDEIFFCSTNHDLSIFI